ncbi:MAG: MBL fold metallo-hydrolase [Nitrospiraceae bacterium]|nr:MBL fold metallo-hydrolase [Nitrospiraceae bacterium]
MAGYVIHPVKLGTFHNVDYSHQVLNTRFGEKIDTAVLSYIVVGENALLVVDTGFRATQDNFDLEGDAEQAFRDKFAELGLELENVTHIVLTHLHWDHMQLNHLFPNATVYVQRREMEVAAAPVYPLYYNHQDIARLLAEDGDRLVFLDGDTEILPGIKAAFAGGHTLGSQMLYVNTSEGTAVITGDVLNLYANLDERSPKEVDVVGWVRAVERIKRDADVILPMHDLEVFERHPVVGCLHD